MSDLITRLQKILGDTYRIERELGGGGMSRVFLADEVALARKVVVKVLPPEMAAGVNKERFRRETQLAASLQHPLIVPILTAGVAPDHDGSDLLYYVMPFIEGQSLREKLDREGELPIGEAVRMLRDVADALGRAHELGVVHRDIKPDNVMLSGKHAMVTDFGIAKAVSAAQDASQSGLTQMGMALGTPMYMSPEQAAGDPNTDERADIYALGVMAYEMVSGKLPFSAETPQAMLAAHVSQTPRSSRVHRSAVPAALDAVIMKCLEKKPADRPQSAEALGASLDSVVSASGAYTPTHTSAVNVAAFVQGNSPLRVATVFAVVSAVIVGVVYLLTMQLGLPGWTIWGAVALAGLGVVLSAGSARTEASGGGTPSWRQTRTTLLSGAGLLGVAVAGYAGARSLGIGPAGTLMTMGMLEERDRVILAQFSNNTPDPTLGETVTELLRVDFAQTPTLTLMDPAQVSEVLRRMERDPATMITEALASEVAQREGIKAILAGDVRSIGDEYIVAARVVAATTGETLAAGRETANAAGLIEAIDDLSASLRKKIGESLRSIRADAPLAQVTTGSTEALRIFAQADRANNLGEDERAIRLLEDAIREDSLFAMAHRKLAIVLSNRSQDPERAQRAFTRAYELRDRLTERERYLAEAAYFTYVEEDLPRAIDAYTSLLEVYPTDRIALNNLAVNYRRQGRLDAAAALYRRSIGQGGAPAVTYMSSVELEYSLGMIDSSRAMLESFRQEYPTHPSIPRVETSFASARFDYDSAETMVLDLIDASRGDPISHVSAFFELGAVRSAQGKMKAGLEAFLQGMERQEEAGLSILPQPKLLFEATLESWVDILFRGDTAAAVQRTGSSARRTTSREPFRARAGRFAVGRPLRSRRTGRRGAFVVGSIRT